MAAKKLLASNVTDPKIDRWYQVAKRLELWVVRSPAQAGRISVLYCPVEKQADVSRQLHEENLHQISFQFDFLGAHILLNSDNQEN